MFVFYIINCVWPDKVQFMLDQALITNVLATPTFDSIKLGKGKGMYNKFSTRLNMCQDLPAGIMKLCFIQV